MDMTIQELTDECAELRDMNEELHYSLQDREW
jgi:hypothetical protein